MQLARNFGEHNAVLAGLRHARGEYVAVLDDDGQNRPRDVLKMLAHARQHKLDVVYGRYRERQHPWPRILGSWFHNRIANFVLGKPRDLYLSSFKVMSRFVVDEVVKFAGPFPYLDGLILRTTSRLGQIEVDHESRRGGRSGYTLPKLVGLWLNMFVGFSIIPLRLVLGDWHGRRRVESAVARRCCRGQVVDQSTGYRGHSIRVGDRGVLRRHAVGDSGHAGRILGRVFLHQSGMPQSVVRYSLRKTASASARQESIRHVVKAGTFASPGRDEKVR